MINGQGLTGIDPGPQVYLTDSGELKGLKNMSDPDVERLAKAIKKQYSPLKWSSSPPDQNGRYYWTMKGNIPTIIWISELDRYWLDGEQYDLPDRFLTKWAGPIPEPEED